jgi:hypothetical protein
MQAIKAQLLEMSVVEQNMIVDFILKKRSLTKVEARLKQQTDFIEKRLAKCKLFDKYKLTLLESNNDIISSLGGELRNIVQGFFTGSFYAQKVCEHCGLTAKTQRCHDKGSSRPQVALSALLKMRPDETKPIKQRDFIKAFIQEHSKVPLWILCQACHMKYDSTNQPKN